MRIVKSADIITWSPRKVSTSPDLRLVQSNIKMFPTRALLGRSVWKGMSDWCYSEGNPPIFQKKCPAHTLNRSEHCPVRSNQPTQLLSPLVLQLPPKSETIGDGVDRIRDTNFIDTVFLSRAHCHLPRIHPQSVLKSAPRRSSPISLVCALQFTMERHTKRFKLPRRWSAANSENTLRMFGQISLAMTWIINGTNMQFR